MSPVLLRVSALAFLAGMVATDTWFFGWRFETSYVQWYFANGTVISLAMSMFTLVWKNLNTNEGLVAADPWEFLRSNLGLVGDQFVVIGRVLERAGRGLRRDSPQRDVPRSASDVFDGAAGLVAGLVIGTTLAVWFVAMVPLQYFIVLIAGAPARLAWRQVTRMADPAVRRDDALVESDVERQWRVNFAAAPVSTANAVAGMLILAVRLIRVLAS